jgi:hypothetical protein
VIGFQTRRPSLYRKALSYTTLDDPTAIPLRTAVEVPLHDFWREGLT